MDKLNKKLAEWAGFKLEDTQFYESSWGTTKVETWRSPNGSSCNPPLNFTESLDACFKWLVPKAIRLQGDTDLSSDNEAMYKLFGLSLIHI